MKRLIVAACLVGALSGCGTLDKLLEVDDDQPAAIIPGDASRVITNVRDAGNSWIPGVGYVLAGLLASTGIAYRIVRKKDEEEDGTEAP